MADAKTLEVVGYCCLSVLPQKALMPDSLPLVRQSDAKAAIDALQAERDAAFAMSKCECSSSEACANLVRLTAEVQCKSDAIQRLWRDRDALQAEVTCLADDRDSWRDQASARTDDALRFAAERDALAEHLKRSEGLLAVALEHNALEEKRAVRRMNAEEDALRKDAARYRWLRGGTYARQAKELRNRGGGIIVKSETMALLSFNYWCTPEELDTAIDAQGAQT